MCVTPIKMFCSLTRRVPGMLANLYRGSLTLPNTSQILRRPCHLQKFENKKKESQVAADKVRYAQEQVCTDSKHLKDVMKKWQEAEEGSPEKDILFEDIIVLKEVRLHSLEMLKMLKEEQREQLEMLKEKQRVQLEERREERRIQRVRVIQDIEEKYKDQFKRPTPSSDSTISRESFPHWPGSHKKRVQEGLPTRYQLAADERDFVLGIGNGFGTGKTELALTGTSTMHYVVFLFIF